MSNLTKLFLGNTNIDFYKLSKTFLKVFFVELIVFITVIILVITNVVSLNLSIDFTGGTLYEVDNISNKKSNEIESFIETLDLNVTRYESINDGEIYRFRTNEGSMEEENSVLNEIST